MTNKYKCMICRSATDDILNLGEMKTFENVRAHYYCLLLASTITQSGEDEDGILGFLPSDIKNEVKKSQHRECVYCHRKGAAVLCSTKSCRSSFHLPCGIANNSGHQFHDRFLSNCRTHRLRQKYKKPTEPQTCPICYESIDFKDPLKILWAPCCKKQSFFHKKCIQQMALSAGYFFKCPMCNNTEVFQKAMKHHGIFIPDRDASWELEPNAFQELLYRHTECNAKICLCKSGRQYDNLGRWNIILCSMCGSQGTHIHCSDLKKNEDWICELCVIDKTTNTAQSQINNIQTQPSTSHETSQTPNNNVEESSSTIQSHRKKRKRIQSFRSPRFIEHDPNLIEIDSEDSDVVVIDDEPNKKCLIAEDRTLLKVQDNTQYEYSNSNTQKNVDIENQDSSSCTDFMNLVITDVRSLSETKDNFIENNEPDLKPFKTVIDVTSREFLNMQSKMYPEQSQQHQQQTPFFVLQEMIYNNNNISIFPGSSNQRLGNIHSSSSDDIVIID